MGAAVLMESVQLTLTVGAAQRQALMARTAPLAERVTAQQALCAALDGLVAHQALHADLGLRGSVEMACNEIATLADLLAAQGDLAAADAAYANGQALARRHGDAVLLARLATDGALHQARLGRPARALAALLEAREAVAASPLVAEDDTGPELKLGLALASLLRWLGDLPRATAALADARTHLAARRERQPNALQAWFADLRGKDLDLETMLLALDRAENSTGDERACWLQEAQAALDRLQPVYEGIDPAAGVGLQFQRCRWLALGGQAAAALKHLDSLTPAFDRLPLLQQKRGTLHVLRARLLLDVNRPEEALDDARQGLEGEQAFGQHETLWKAWWQLARARRATGATPAQLLQANDGALAALDLLRTQSLGLRLDNLALRAARPMVDQAVADAAAQGDGLRAAHYVDAVKSRFLARALLAGPPPVPRPDDVAQLDALNARIDRIQGAPAREALVAARTALIESMRLQGVAFDAELAGVDLGATLHGLSARGQAALQLFLAGDTLTAVLLMNGRATVDTRRLDAAVLAALEGFERNLLVRPFELQHAPAYDPRAWGLDAGHLLPDGLLDAALGAAALLLCPHGRLHLLPWPALSCGGRRLFEHLPVATLPNLACIEALASRPLGDGRVALIGAPQPAHASRALLPTEAELDDLAALYGPEALAALPCRGGAATLEAYRALVADAAAQGAALHVATHGLFEPDDPAGAALCLTGRRLTAAEIALHPLPFREVTLSACSTGWRPTTVADVELVGDDLVGLPSAFLEAGAALVLNSITPLAPAASAAFLTGFHRRRRDGVAPLEAFAATQRALLAEGRLALCDWIGFSLIAAR